MVALLNMHSLRRSEACCVAHELTQVNTTSYKHTLGTQKTLQFHTATIAPPAYLCSLLQLIARLSYTAIQHQLAHADIPHGIRQFFVTLHGKTWQNKSYREDSTAIKLNRAPIKKLQELTIAPCPHSSKCFRLYR